MEHYILVILMLTPGFIAKETARMVGNIKKKSSALEQGINYFVYSFFTLALIGSLFLLMEYIQVSVMMQLGILILSIPIVGVLVGIIWQLFLKHQFIKMCRWLSIRFTGYEYFQEDSLLNTNMMDGEHHLIEVIKDGERVAAGDFLGASFGTDEVEEMKVNSHPVYAEWLDDERYASWFQHKCVFLDFTHDIRVIEYTYPKGFFDAKFDPNKITF